MKTCSKKSYHHITSGKVCQKKHKKVSIVTSDGFEETLKSGSIADANCMVCGMDDQKKKIVACCVCDVSVHEVGFSSV